MERLVLARPSQDPLQFTYQPHVGVDDSIIYLLQKAYSSLDGPNTSVRIVFFDFSSAFNTIQPRLLRAKLGNTRVGGAPRHLGRQLSDRKTAVCEITGTVCLISYIRPPRELYCPPFLFTTYTADFKYCTESCHLQKFCDDTAIVGCVEGGREAKYRDLVDHFVKWCGGEPPAAERGRQEEQAPALSCLHRWDGCGDGTCMSH
ncbi:hypothetical protein N1851_003487 [Merluccius polli]|uniref:Reverse transcriptase domain-containing protein n=1 Tax=Merluccius polli TaxID=89951 RepID=A0AA47N9K7_MERPO|nr:hypothetical protein N1851_003487 [Merluccius polli]